MVSVNDDLSRVQVLGWYSPAQRESLTLMDFMHYLCCDWDLVHVSYIFYHWMYPDSYFNILRQSLAKLLRLVLNPRLPPPHPPPNPG